MRVVDSSACRDIGDHPTEFFYHDEHGVHIPVSYNKVWEDGFGARGWKINVTIGDPVIIASTRETGGRIDTSVFVHDVLDHFMSGFGISGHRAEAMALAQLARRTGSDIRPDYEQMVKEDLLHGRVNGETLRTFLPEDLVSLLPEDIELSNSEAVAVIKTRLGEQELFERLVQRFYELGDSGKAHAVRTWKGLGLDPNKRTEIGRALQTLLTQADIAVEEVGIEHADARITVSNDICALELISDVGDGIQKKYAVDVA